VLIFLCAPIATIHNHQESRHLAMKMLCEHLALPLYSHTNPALGQVKTVIGAVVDVQFDMEDP
jgi:hypothetical protein